MKLTKHAKNVAKKIADAYDACSNCGDGDSDACGAGDSDACGKRTEPVSQFYYNSPMPFDNCLLAALLPDRKEPFLHRLERTRDYVEAPLKSFHKWRAIIITDEGAYENTRVDNVQRNLGEDASLTVTFAAMTATRPTVVRAIIIIDHEDRHAAVYRCKGKQGEAAVNSVNDILVAAGDDFIPRYAGSYFAAANAIAVATEPKAAFKVAFNA